MRPLNLQHFAYMTNKHNNVPQIPSAPTNNGAGMFVFIIRSSITNWTAAINIPASCSQTPHNICVVVSFSKPLDPFSLVADKDPRTAVEPTITTLITFQNTPTH